MSQTTTPTPAEEKLIKAANEGQIEDYSDHSSADPTPNDPAQGSRWGPERTIRAEIIYALVVGTNPEWPVHAKGVQAAGAKIVGALDFRAAKISRPLLLINCYVAEPIDLIDATACTIALNGSHVGSITAFRLATSGSVFLNKGFLAEQGVELYAAHIGGDLDCDGGTMNNSSGPSLFADGLEVQGNVFLRAWHPRAGCVKPFRAVGEVQLKGVYIRGDFDCSTGIFIGAGGRALSADRLTVDGEICLRNGFYAKGEVRVLGGKVGGNLDCTGSTFENPEGIALNADSLSVGGSVFLSRGFQARGAVRFVGAKINGDLNCKGSSLSAEATSNNRHGLALSIDRAEMGELFLRDLAHRPVGTVSLAYAKAGLLSDDLLSWPQEGRLWLDGFVYDTIAAAAPTQAKDRLNWLRRQPKGEFCPQPYEQLIRVLRQMGHERDARKIAISKQRTLRRSGQLGPGACAWNFCLGVTVGYGYRSWLPLVWAVIVVVVGAFLFQHAAFRRAADSNVLAVASAPAAPRQKPDAQGGKSEQPHPILYSIDVFLPFADLHQKKTWLLDEGKRDFLGYEFWYLFEELAGWVLTGLLIAALTGIIKKD